MIDETKITPIQKLYLWLPALIILLLLALIAAGFVAPYFIDYYYGSQPAHTIRETIPRYPSIGSTILVLEGTIHCDNCELNFSPVPNIFPSLWLEDVEKSRINLSIEYDNLIIPLPWEQVKVIGYYQRTEADFGLTGMYEFVPKRILKE